MSFFFEKGQESQKKGNYQEVLQHYQQCLGQNLNDDDCLFGIGSVWHQQKKYQLAEQYYQQCLKINPKNVDCLINQSKVLYLDSKYEKAMQYANECVKYYPFQSYSYEIKGTVQYIMGEIYESSESFRECLKLQNDHILCTYFLANSSFVCQNMDQAEKAALQFINLIGKKKNDDDENIHQDGGQKNDYDQKIAEVLQNPEYLSSCYLILGGIEKLKKNTQKAKQYFKECFRLDPNNDICYQVQK